MKRTASLASASIRVWDLPTRVFHWTLVVCVFSLFVTGLSGMAMDWHMRIGSWVLTLLLWRLIWGVIGGHYARFSQFLYSPITIWRYLRGHARPEHQVGHNPLGALSVWAMLAALGLQVVTGLVSDDEITNQGPLFSLVSNATASTATFLHKQVGKPLLMGLVLLHVLAILWYVLSKRQNLVKAMLSGNKTIPASMAILPAPSDLPSSKDGAWHRALAAATFVATAVLVYVLVYVLPQRLG